MYKGIQVTSVTINLLWKRLGQLKECFSHSELFHKLWEMTLSRMSISTSIQLSMSTEQLGSLQLHVYAKACRPLGWLTNLVKCLPTTPLGESFPHPWGDSVRRLPTPTLRMIDLVRCLPTSSTLRNPSPPLGWWTNLVRHLATAYTIYGKKFWIRYGHSGSKETNCSILRIDNYLGECELLRTLTEALCGNQRCYFTSPFVSWAHLHVTL